MANYIPNSQATQKSMLAELPLTMEELFAVIDPELRAKINLPDGKSEMEVLQEFEKLANLNQIFPTVFRGAGAYKHYIPSTVNAIANREEFLTAYTPYQAEMSQGILQSIFEYQTMICQLTGLSASNASVYDGATACAEAVNMCRARNKNKMLVASTINPQYQEVIKTYFRYNEIDIVFIPSVDGRITSDSLGALLTEDVMGVLIQSPNYYGIFEDCEALGNLIHQNNSTFVLCANPLSFGISASAKELGADICVGEAQPLGMELSYGGPYLGYMTCSEEYLRKLPGRVVGQTTDINGKEAYVLTLQAREQHIRREKATSSICSNQANCALRAAVYLATLGPNGFREVSLQSYQNAHLLKDSLLTIDGFSLAYDQPFFNEFVTKSEVDSDVVLKALAKEGILGGLKLDDQHILWCATECNSEEDIIRVVKIIKEVSGCR